MPNRALDELKVSDETGEAVLANIQSDRAISATTLDVDSLDNWPQKFIFATGTKDANNRIDASSITIMYGHQDAGDIIIDGFAPGYSDAGNTANQIAIVKPNTYAMDELISLIQVILDNDGNMKVDAPITGGSTIADGWISAEPVSAWAYSAWDSTTRIAQITVPTDATTKYNIGDRIKFTQPTDGVKYGILHKIEATTLHVFMHANDDLDNEAITAPFFSRKKVPFGFDPRPDKWTLTYLAPGAEAETTGLTVYQQLGSAQLAIGPGAWLLSARAYVEWIYNSATRDLNIALSTSATAVSDEEMYSRDYNGNANTGATIYHKTYSFWKPIFLTGASTVLYITGKIAIGGTEIDLRSESFIRATSGYL